MLGKRVLVLGLAIDEDGVVNGVDKMSSRFGLAPRLDDESGYLALFGG